MPLSTSSCDLISTVTGWINFKVLNKSLVTSNLIYTLLHRDIFNNMRPDNNHQYGHLVFTNDISMHMV